MAVESWPPTRYTPPLSADFPSHGDNLIRFAELAWTTPENPKGLQLDPWQKAFIRAVLEVYPPGHPRAGELRYRQVVLSVARQAGKSTLASIFVFYGLLMHVAGPYVLGIASSADQARIIYDRVLYAIASKPELKALFAKTTETRGIKTADGSGRYEIKAAKGAALQGLPVSLVLFDELHIGKAEMWNAVLEGMKTRKNGLVIGIMTAGSPESTLLLDLYARGAQAIAGHDERFGFFCYEAPEGCSLDDPDAYRAANPALACGRLDVETVMNDVKGRPEPDVRRYSLNQFTTSSEASWLAPYVWESLPTSSGVITPTHVAVAVTPGQEWATLTFARKDGEQVSTAVFCHMRNASVDRLAAVCERIARRARVTFVMEGTQKALKDRLQARGMRAEFLNVTQLATAAATAHRKIVEGQVSHDASKLTGRQMGRGAWKATGGVAKLIPIGNAQIDALTAQVMAIHSADVAMVAGLGIKAA